MSKIEKALDRARGERGNWPALVAVANDDDRPATGTALAAEWPGHAVTVETIARMTGGELRLLEADELSSRGIIRPEQGEDPAVQVFRDLRTKIVQQNQGHNAVILVTAVTRHSGSSFIARNLAAAFAFDPAKTALLVDCNLKNPSVHQLLDDGAAPGLTDYLEKPGIDIGDIILPVGVSRLRVIAAGGRREIPAEYFTSHRMRRLMDALRRRYRERFIVLDGPPMSEIADIRVLSELSDYTIVVARYGHATNTQMENGLKAIDKRTLLGVVFNDEPRIPSFG
jgi:protein-tyrosine kinase